MALTAHQVYRGNQVSKYNPRENGQDGQLSKCPGKGDCRGTESERTANSGPYQEIARS